MKYTPGLPEKNNNVSHEHPLREFVVLLAGAAAVILTLLFLLGYLVDSAVRYIDPELEATLFATFQTGEAAPQTEQEQEVQALLDQLGECIDVGYPVVVSITESEDLNAFALPGGQVVILSGLVDKMETENGLAFVLAHELGHFKHRDHLRGMGRSVVLLATSVMLTGSNSDLSALLTPVYSAGEAQFSQDRESDADAVALHALNCHYGHVGGATEFFKLIAEPGEDLDWSLMHYFSSHPEAQSRIDEIQKLAEERGYATQ